MKSAMPIALTAALMATPLAAQEDLASGSTEDDYTVNQLIIYGDDECPQSSGNEIVVCARKAENERYRIPENLRFSEDPANESWAARALSFETNSPYGQYACTPVGNTGGAGCTAQLIDAAFEERRTGSAVRFSQLIEEARAERLETIDADAADEQSRVEELERQYLERLEREREAELPGEEPLPQIAPITPEEAAGQAPPATAPAPDGE